MDGKISWVSGWVTVFSLNDISGLTRPKNIKFGTKVAPSTRMMHSVAHTWICGENVYLWQNLKKKLTKISQKIAALW